jgi:hypothetical protein
VYLKLRVANRTELAVAMATHAPPSPSPGTSRPVLT